MNKDQSLDDINDLSISYQEEEDPEDVQVRCKIFQAVVQNNFDLVKRALESLASNVIERSLKLNKLDKQMRNVLFYALFH